LRFPVWENLHRPVVSSRVRSKASRERPDGGLMAGDDSGNVHVALCDFALDSAVPMPY
jgi:hypothetical protein